MPEDYVYLYLLHPFLLSFHSILTPISLFFAKVLSTNAQLRVLVTTPSSTFGEVKGGDTSYKNRREEQQLAAFEDKKVNDETEHRQRRLKQQTSSSSCSTIPELLEVEFVRI